MATALLFDFDGTIADTFDLSLSIGRAILDSLKLRHLSEEEIVQFRNRPFSETVRTFKIPLRKIPALLIKIRRGIHDHIEEIAPFSGIREILSELRLHSEFMGIVTSNTEENVQQFLAKYDINIFDAGSYSSAILGKASKLRRFIRKSRLSKEETIYIGDTTDDIAACRKAGIRVAAVTWGYNAKGVLEAARPDFLIEKVDDLKNIIR